MILYLDFYKYISAYLLYYLLDELLDCECIQKSSVYFKVFPNHANVNLFTVVFNIKNDNFASWEKRALRHLYHTCHYTRELRAGISRIY